MSSDDYSPPPSGGFSRLPSIDPTQHVSYAPQPAAPSFPSIGTTTSEPQLTTTSQSSVAPDKSLHISPVLSDIRPLLKSTNEITGGFSARDPDPTRSSAPGFTGLGPHNPSANEVTGKVASEAKAPTIAGLAERDRSDNGENGETESESVNPQDYLGISLVGKKFKQVNPEAYYVEKDDPYY